jgi:hypothetical protein
MELFRRNSKVKRLVARKGHTIPAYSGCNIIAI